jgi:hypothetical protein
MNGSSVHSSLYQGPNACVGPGLHGLGRHTTATLCATLKPELDLVGYLAVRDAIGNYEAIYNEPYTTVYFTITRHVREWTVTSTAAIWIVVDGA